MYANRFIRTLQGLNQLKKSTLMNDSMVVGLISGTLGAITIELFNLLLGKKLFFGKVASSMVVNPLRSMRLKNILFGEIMHLTVGAGIGSIMSVLLKKTGKDLVILKGTFVSLLAWIGLHNLGNKMDLFSIKPHSTKNHYFALIQHVLYGITTSAVMKYIANPDAFQQSSITKSKRQPSERNLLYDQPFSPPKIDPNLRDFQELQFKYPTA